MTRRWIALAVGIVVSAVFLYIGLRDANLAAVWDIITRAHVLWLIPGVVVYFLAVWGRTWRWHYLLRPIKPISLSTLFPIVVIGYMGNNVYPFRAGEVIRAYILKRSENVTVTASLTTIVVERLFDGLVMLIFVFVALPFAHIEQEWLRTIIILGTLVFFGALAVFLVLALQPERARKLFAGLIERKEFVRAADVDLPDPDLRNRVASPGLLLHFGAQPRLPAHVDLFVFRSLLVQKPLGPEAVGAEEGCVDCDLGHPPIPKQN